MSNITRLITDKSSMNNPYTEINNVHQMLLNDNSQTVKVF